MRKKRICLNCDFYDESGQATGTRKWGHCRIRAAHPKYGWAQVYENNFCGEFEKRRKETE